MRIAAPTPSAASTKPIPRCPPSDLGNLAYAFRLNKMSGADLNTELERQQGRLYVAEHGFVGNPAVAKDARAKIGLLNKEIASRKPDAAAYAKQVHKMSDKALLAEIKNQQGRVWVAQHGIRYDPVAEKDALEKLKTARAEAASRGLEVPVGPPFGIR